MLKKKTQNLVAKNGKQIKGNVDESDIDMTALRTIEKCNRISSSNNSE